jgi:hypothetical protein
LAVFLTTSCSKIDDPVSPPKVVNGTGLNKNTSGALEAVSEADFNDELLVSPAIFSLDGPPIVTQQETSKCSAFSSAYFIIGLYNGLNSASQDFDKAGSPEFAYTYYKKINNDDCKSGSYMFNQTNVVGMAEILETVGTTSWNQLPFVNSNVCTITNATQITQATVNKIGGYARLDEDQFTNTDELKRWIYGGYPLWFGVDIDDTFSDLGSKIWTSSPGKSEGGHAMTLVGWDDSKKAFKIANSWGKEWGENGYGWVSYDHLKKLLTDSPTIGVLFPNERQKTLFSKLTPSSCGNASWGEVEIENKTSNEVAIELIGKNYSNKKTTIDANDNEQYITVPKGEVKVKVLDPSRTTILKEYTINVIQCGYVSVAIN